MLWLEIRVQLQKGATVDKPRSVAGVDVALGRHTLSKYDIVVNEFEVPDFDMVARRRTMVRPLISLSAWSAHRRTGMSAHV